MVLPGKLVVGVSPWWLSRLQPAFHAFLKSANVAVVFEAQQPYEKGAVQTQPVRTGSLGSGVSSHGPGSGAQGQGHTSGRGQIFMVQKKKKVKAGSRGVRVMDVGSRGVMGVGSCVRSITD